MRWHLIGIGLLLLAAMANAQTTISRVTEERVSFHSIDILVSADGSATVTEQFFFNFFADEDTQLESDFQENTPSLAEWKRDYPFIHPYIGIESQVEGLEFLLKTTVSNQPTLQLSYRYPIGLIQKISTDNQGRTTRWKLSETTLLNFISSGSIRVNEKTQVKIHLPAVAVVDKRSLPLGLLDTTNTVTLSNFQSNALSVEYILITPIADPIDTSKLISDFLQSPLFLFLLAALALVIAYMYINRESISTQVENYIVEHSEFKTPKTPEVEEEIE